MSVTVLTLSELQTAALAKLRILFPTRSTHSESLLGKWAAALAGVIWSLHDKVQQVDWDATPQDSSTYEALALWAYDLGIGDGTASGFGPLGATEALGLTVLVSGTPATVVWNGVAPAPTLVAADGVTLFEMTAAATIGGGGTVSTVINATTAGTAGNLDVGDVVTFVSTIPGVTSATSVTVAATTAGTDAETKAALLDRILNRLQLPPKGGTQNDWDVWCTEAETLAQIGRVHGYARRNGTGTVDEVVTLSASGTGRQVSAGDRTIIGTYLDTVRPVCVEGRRVLTPTMPAGNALTLRTRIIAYPVGSFDWASTTLGLTVAVWAAGPPAVLTLSADAPADLVAAVAAASEPRLQVIETGGSVVPTLVKVTAIGGAGNRELTLENPLPTGFIAPTVGDAVYSGGDAVVPIATAQLAHVDSLGPSRSSGYANPDDAWNDLVSTEQLAHIALDTVDGSGNALAKNIVKIANVPQVTIKVGVGAPSTTDYQTGDTLSAAPECAYCVHVAVTD